MESMTKLELVNDQEIEDYKQFCQYKQELSQWHKNWQEVIGYANKMQYGSFNLTIKDAKPVRIDNPMQQIVIGFGVKI